MKYYVDKDSSYLGGADGKPLSDYEVPFPPEDARQIWNGVEYDPISIAILDTEKNNVVDFTNIDPFLKAYVLAVNDGSIVPGGNMTNAALKAAVKAKL